MSDQCDVVIEYLRQPLAQRRRGIFVDLGFIADEDALVVRLEDEVEIRVIAVWVVGKDDEDRATDYPLRILDVLRRKVRPANPSHVTDLFFEGAGRALDIDLHMRKRLL